MSDLFSSLLIFTIIKTILSTFFHCFLAGTTTLDREWSMIICQNLKDVCIVFFYRRESIYRWNGITFGLVLNIYKQTTSIECLQLEQINNK